MEIKEFPFAKCAHWKWLMTKLSSSSVLEKKNTHTHTQQQHQYEYWKCFDERASRCKWRERKKILKIVKKIENIFFSLHFINLPQLNAFSNTLCNVPLKMTFKPFSLPLHLQYCICWTCQCQYLSASHVQIVRWHKNGKKKKIQFRLKAYTLVHTLRWKMVRLLW